MDQYQLWETICIKKGELMFSYRFGKMNMNNVANGTKKMNTNSVMSSPNGASNNLG